MPTALYIFTQFIKIMLGALQIALLVRAVFSWLPTDEEGTVLTFVTHITEPVLLPVRNLLSRSESISSMPIDLSFIVTFMIVTLIGYMLP